MALTYKGVASRRYDGNAVTVTIPAGQTWTAGKLYYAQGFHGISQSSGVGGDLVALATDRGVYELAIGAGVTAVKGDVLYITTDGTNTINATNTNRPALKVVKAKDANNVIWAQVLENR